jgi:phospholipase/carboxylesterase
MMNRIKLSPLALQSSTETLVEATPQPALSAAVPIANRDEYSLFVPLHYEKKYAYPLIVWLHADGQSANQLQEVMLQISMRNYVAVAPQSFNGNSQSGYFWDQSWETIEHARKTIVSAVDQARARCNIHSQRIYIAGMGSGGTMAFRIGLSNPETFAGIMSLHGPLPGDQSPLRDWNRCRRLPIYWTHARAAKDFAQDQLCRQLRLLHIAGFTVNLRQYAQAESTCPQMLADMNRWVMEMISTSVSG